MLPQLKDSKFKKDWDSRSYYGIPVYDSTKDKFCKVAQLRKFNENQIQQSITETAVKEKVLDHSFNKFLVSRAVGSGLNLVDNQPLLRKLKSREILLEELHKVIELEENLSLQGHVIDLVNAIRVETLEIIEEIKQLKISNNKYINDHPYLDDKMIQKMATDMDFMDEFEEKTHLFGFEFHLNPLAYKDGGSIITLNHQKFDDPHFQKKHRLRLPKIIDGIDSSRLHAAERFIQSQIDVAYIDEIENTKLINKQSDPVHSSSNDSNKARLRHKKSSKPIKSKSMALPAMLESRLSVEEPVSTSVNSSIELGVNDEMKKSCFNKEKNRLMSRLAEITDMLDGLKSKQRRLEEEVQGEEVRYNQTGTRLIHMRSWWEKQQEPKPNLLEIQFTIEKLSNIKRNIAKLKQEIFFLQLEYNRVNKNRKPIINALALLKKSAKSKKQIQRFQEPNNPENIIENSIEVKDSQLEVLQKNVSVSSLPEDIS